VIRFEPAGAEALLLVLAEQPTPSCRYASPPWPRASASSSANC